MADGKKTQARVLIVDSDPGRARDLSHRLKFLKYDPVIAENPDQCEVLVRDSGVAMVLGDTGEPALREAVQLLASDCPDMPVLHLDDIDVDDGLGKEFANRPHWKLDAPVRRSQLSQLLRRAERYEGQERRQRITGESRPIQKVRRLIEQVADYDINVLITGESGTGKELVARTIHDLSDRAGMPFVPINCGAIPPDLLESELFGHKKGAFTGAVSDRTGRFELAEGGTLFLDEIGDMSLDMQVKLLRVLQERCFERVGSNDTRQSNVRIIAATHCNLPEAVESADFREDLYYRLSVFPIEMPPLYKRKTDLPQLLDELLIQHQGADAGNLRVSQDALSVLTGYSWPGNIRELSNLVERLAILCPEGEIGVDDLPAKYRDPANRRSDVDEDSQIDREVPVTLTGVSLKLHLREIEVGLIRKAMAQADGVVAAAARLLNMRRTTLVEKLAKYEISY